MPRQGVLGAASVSSPSGKAHVSGVAGCVATTKTVKVSGRSIRSVVLKLDGKKLHVKKAKKSKKSASAVVTFATAKVKGASLEEGTHRLTARVTFTDGTKAKTLSLRFARCATPKPSFTG